MALEYGRAGRVTPPFRRFPARAVTAQLYMAEMAAALGEIGTVRAPRGG
jgi:hypothetical protein